jgi:hypothetical protein
MAAESKPPILLNPEHKEIHSAIGRAVDAYAMVEGSQVFILQSILAIAHQPAATIFYAVQNVRTRHEMIQSLLNIRFGDTYKKYWASCGKFLQKLADFRNAIVHWQPVVTIYVKASTDPVAMIQRPSLITIGRMQFFLERSVPSCPRELKQS